MACFDAHSICNQIAFFERLDVVLIFNLEAQIITGHYCWQQKLFQIQIKFFFGTLISILDHNSFTAESINKDEDEFGRMLKKRAEDGGKIKVVSVSKVESEIEVKELLTLQEVIAGVQEKFPGFKHIRIPVYNSAAPLEKDFDTLCQSLIGSNVNTPVIVNCQVRTKRLFIDIFKASISRDTFLQNWVKVVESATILWFKSVGTPCIDVNGSANIFEVKYMSN